MYYVGNSGLCTLFHDSNLQLYKYFGVDDLTILIGFLIKIELSLFGCHRVLSHAFVSITVREQEADVHNTARSPPKSRQEDVGRSYKPTGSDQPKQG